MKATILTICMTLAFSPYLVGQTAWANPQIAPERSSVLQAQAQLDQARRAYQDEVRDLAVALNLDMRAVAAHRRDLSVIIPNFSDAEVRLRQRFSDGDRIGTWPQIRRLSLAWRANATPRQRVLAAARARSDAVLFGIMVSARDVGATNGELLALWDEASALDPRAFEAHMGKSRSAFAIGDRARATAAAEMAQAAALTPADVAEANEAKARALDVR